MDRADGFASGSLRALSRKLGRITWLTAPLMVLVALCFGFLGWYAVTQLSRRTPRDSVNLAALAAQAPKDMALIPGQTFEMGSTEAEIQSAYEDCLKTTETMCHLDTFQRERSIRLVTVSSFFLDQFEVTNREYAEFLNRSAKRIKVNQSIKGDRQIQVNGIELLDMYFDETKQLGSGIVRSGDHYLARPGFEQLPITQVSWRGARIYCQAQGKELPTEAQWELAARGGNLSRSGTLTRFPWGNELPSCEGVVTSRIPGGMCPDTPTRMVPVGSSKQDHTLNGIYELGGNVSEWVLDRFIAPYPDCGTCLDPKAVTGPEHNDGVTYRVARGGSWSISPIVTRAASRSRFSEKTLSPSIGFRCAVSPTVTSAL